LKKSKSFKNAKGGNPYQQRAYETWLDMRSFYGDKLDAAAVRSGMNACVVTRRTEEAETIFEDSVSCSSSSSSSDEEEESSSIAFNILIKGYGYERNLDKLDRVMPKMKELGAQPTESTYNTLVNAYTNMNRVDKAWRVMQDAVQRGNDNKKEINTKVVSEDCKQYMYATILKGFIKSVNFEGSGMQPAIDLINQMKLKGVEPDVYVYAQLMDYLIKKRKDVDAAEYLFQQMQLGSNGGVAPNVVVYNILLRGYSDQEGKGWSRMKSLELLKEMGTKGIKPNSSTFNTLISAAASNGDSQAASKLFNLMVDLKVEPDRMTFTTIMKNFSDLRMPDEVARVFKQLDASAFGGADKIAFNCLIGAYGKAGQLAEAEAAYYKMMNRSIKPDRVTFNSLVRACCSEKSMKSAVMFIKMASGKQIRIAMPLYDLTLKACIAEESFDLASDILTSMEQVRIKRREFKIREDFVSFSLEEHKKKKLSSAKKDEREKGNSVAMERVKFWMGLPNQYYSDSDEDWRQ
jgi:pentatricopeptide repeat protein